jgi:hypothetical protein
MATAEAIKEPALFVLMVVVRIALPICYLHHSKTYVASTSVVIGTCVVTTTGTSVVTTGTCVVTTTGT